MKTPMIKLERSKSTVKSYIALMFILMGLHFMVVMPLKGPNEYMLPCLIMLVFTNIFYVWATFRNPGYVENSEKISFVKLNQYFDPSYLCANCQILKPKDSRHCGYCNRCVDRHDHHCQWLDNCIGLGNHNIFFVYVLSTWAFLLFLDVICFLNLDVVVDKAMIMETANTKLSPFYKISYLQDHPTFTKILVDIVLLAVITLASLFLVPVTMILTL
jgi:hypothetical protein